MVARICMAESLCCSPETITTLLIGHSPIQNKKKFFFFKNHHHQQKRIRLPMREMQEMGVLSLGQVDPLEEEMTTLSSTLAWKIPWTKEPGGLQSVGLRRVGHDWATEHTEHMITVGLSYTAFSMWRLVPFIFPLLYYFIINGCWILSDAHFYIYWDEPMVLILDFVNVV